MTVVYFIYQPNDYIKSQNMGEEKWKSIETALLL